MNSEQKHKALTDYIETHTPLSTGDQYIDVSRIHEAGETICSADWQKLDLSILVSIIRLLYSEGAIRPEKIGNWLYNDTTEALRGREEIKRFRYAAEA